MKNPHSGRARKSFWEESPAIALFVLILSILLAEGLINLLINELAPTLSVTGQIILDVFLLLFIVFPLLYSVVLNPLLRQISIRRQAEAALDRSEERTLILTESLQNLTLEINADLRVSHMGSMLSSFIGHAPEEVIGSATVDFLTETSKQTFIANLAHVCAGQKDSGANSVTRINDYELLRKDGSSVWAEVTATIVFDNDNRLERIVGVFRDISDRKEAERSLLKANILLQKTISSLNEAVFIVATGSRRIEEVNNMAEKMFGYTREELIGAHTSILHLNDEMFQWFGNEMLSSYKANGSFQTTYRMKRKDGTFFPSEHYVSPIINDDGNYQCHVCVVRDISARIQAEEALVSAFSALAERKCFVESIITNLQSGIIVTDNELRITMANPYVLDLCRLTAEEILGMGLQDICPAIAEQIVADVNANEIFANFSGNEFTLGFTRLDLKNADKIKVGHIINFRDLTDIVKIRTMIQQKDRLSAMGEVVAGVAHEMRNPLFGMTTVGQILDMELTLSPQHQQLMDSFMKESRRLNNLVQDLLDGTRELKLRIKQTNINHVLDASVQVCQMHLQEKKIKLIRTNPGSELLLQADPEKLEQVFVNLIHNAVDASAPGGAIEILLEADSRSISVIVIDSGAGIPEKILPNIFDVFFTSKKSGTGMGLSISRNIAEAHGGTLKAENIAGEGAKFSLKLPLNGDKS